MMIPCNYEINVATKPEKNAEYGRHYCRIELGQCTEKEARAKLNKLNEKLGDEFNLKLIKVMCSSEWIDEI